MAVLLAAAGGAAAQDLYDTTVLRTIHLQFHQADWLTRLRNNYASQTNILADMTVDSVVYPSVGVRIRGNTSYTALPAGSEKFSLNVDINFVNTTQELMGHKSLNLNNGWRDPTFCREVMYNNYVARFIPHMRSNHVVVTLNGQNWGVYANVQQFAGEMLGPYFPDTSGLTIKCANTPNGPGLRYNGALPSGYTGYEIKETGGLADPWAPLIDVCNSLTNEPLATWHNMDTRFACDPAAWSVVFENLLTDDDSYVNKGADFMTYRDPLDGRMYLLQTDANETFTQATWAITRNFTALNKPVLNRLLAVAEMRQRYMAHYRTARADLNWAYFGPIAAAHRALIDAAVQADTRKLYSYTLFQQNFTQTVTMPHPGLAGGTMIGLQQFVDQRASFLNSQAELTAVGPAISALTPASTHPDPGQPVTFTATVTPAGSPVLAVDLYYRTGSAGVFQRTPMTPAGPNQYAATPPTGGVPGRYVEYYVRAVASNTYQSQSYLPARTEYAPDWLEYAFGSSGGMRITEWMYSGPSGEFIEFTNRSAAPVDMTGWSYDDDHGVPGAFGLGAFGVVQPGESVIVTESAEVAFRAAWNLPPSVKVIGELGVVSGHNLSRNDEINLYDSGGQVVDRLRFGDQAYPGTIRTLAVSGQACRESIGQNGVELWELSAPGDRYGSYMASTGEIGSPGGYTAPSCTPCYANCDQSTASPVLNVADFSCFLQRYAAGDPYANCDQSTAAPVLNVGDFSCFLQQYAAGCP